jgi:hypothetical protein
LHRSIANGIGDYRYPAEFLLQLPQQVLTTEKVLMDPRPRCVTGTVLAEYPFANLAKLLSVDNDGGWQKRH